MHISFHHANPTAGNESVLVRFERDDVDENPCLLVDAGQGVDVDDLLRPTDDLVGICLTHAHLDHYSAISDAHRDDVPIFTSPATAAVLEDVFDVAGVEYGVRTTDAVADAVTPIDDWTTIAPGIEVHPVPAGHIPGAVGFLVRATDGGDTHHLLATGDFTRRRAGGFPGLDPDGFVDVDAVFLTGATNESFGESLTDALGTALEHAHGGAPTLVAVSGLVGVQVAYLLANLAEEYGLGVPIRVVGQVAKLYDRLDYDCSGVEAIPLFTDPQTCLGRGVITIAGPEIPSERSSGRLFGLLREDPNACVVQLIGSGEDPLTDGQCTIHSYELVNHPTRQTLESVHDAIDPTETVVVHRHGGAGGTFNELDSVVWGGGDTDEYTLYDGDQWRLPPWAGGGTVAHSGEQSLHQFAGNELLASFSLPSLDRHDDPDFEAEGIDDEEIATLLHQGSDAATSPDAPGQTASEQPESSAETATETERPMTTDNESTDSEDDEKSTHRPTGLVDTTGVDLRDRASTGGPETLDDSSITPKNLISTRATKKLAEEQNGTDSSDDSHEEDSHGDDETASEPEGDAEQNAGTESKSKTESEAGPESESETEEPNLSDRDTPDGPEAEDERDSEDGREAERDGRTPAESTDHEEDSETDGTPEAEDDRSPDVERDELPDAEGEDESDAEEDESDAEKGESPAETDTDSERTDSDSEETDVDSEKTDTETTDDETVAMTLNPVAVAVAEWSVTVAANDGVRSVDELATEAVQQYLLALLAGEAAGDEDERFSVGLTGSPGVERAVEDLVGSGDEFESTAALVAEGLTTVLDGDVNRTVELRGLADYREYLDAVVRNPAYVFDDREAVVEAAINWTLVEA